MKRSGFSMIELIFVIVIMGILAAVAVPKMMGTSSKAKVSSCKTFYSSLNGTVSPTLWMNMVQGDAAGASDAYSEENISAAINVDGKCGTLAQISDLATDGTQYHFDIDGVRYDVNGSAATTAESTTWTMTKH